MSIIIELLLSMGSTQKRKAVCFYGYVCGLLVLLYLNVESQIACCGMFMVDAYASIKHLVLVTNFSIISLGKVPTPIVDHERPTQLEAPPCQAQ